MNVIITGATGMVGEGVLHECLQHPAIQQVLVIGRKPCNKKHSKLKEIIVPNFMELDSIQNQVVGYNACYFCLGVSSVGMKEDKYFELTYTLTLNFAKLVHAQNPDLIFSYISGASTDSSEKGKLMWARVKGKTENDLLKLFKKAYMFRPGFMKPTKGLNNVLPAYKYFIWMYPIIKLFFPNYASTLAEVGQAMINTTIKGYDKNILEVKDILKQAKLN